MPISIISTTNIMTATGEIKEVLIQFSGVNLSQVDYISGTVKADSNFHNLSTDDKNKVVLDKIKAEFWPEPFNEDKIISIDATVEEFITLVNQKVNEVTTKAAAAETSVNFVAAEVSKAIEKNALLTENLNKIAKQVLKSEISQDDYAAMIDVFPEWQIETAYKTGDVVRYNFSAWEVIQDHTSQEDWSPELVAALFKQVTPKTTTDPTTGETIEVIADFVQPTGAQDVYMIGDKVQFESKVYESVIDNNTYSPTAYAQGWKLV